MNEIIYKLKRKMNNKKENTKKLKYESLLEENQKKNTEIINLLYERIETNNKIEEYEKTIEMLKNRCTSFEEKVNILEDKKAELLHELEKKTTRKVKKNG